MKLNATPMIPEQKLGKSVTQERKKRIKKRKRRGRKQHTPWRNEPELLSHEKVSYQNQILYRSMLESLMYAFIETRLDIAFTVSKLNQFQNASIKEAWDVIKY